MSFNRLDLIRDLLQEDVNGRGLQSNPARNLINAFPNDFREACQSLAQAPRAAAAVVTGFFIPGATPPAAETDGPLGAVFLARGLMRLGIRTVLVADPFCQSALRAGLDACGLAGSVPVLRLPPSSEKWSRFITGEWLPLATRLALTHLVALERAGPSHTPESLRRQRGWSPVVHARFLSEVSPEHHDRCHDMRGQDITATTSPAHLLFEAAAQASSQLVTIGIGDGGNEIGMGKIDWQVIRENVPRGGTIGCRVPTDHLIVCGVSNWGAYGLATGVCHLRGLEPDAHLLDPQEERRLLQIMVDAGPLVDGVTGRQTPTIDGLSFERYAEPLLGIAKILRARV